jgi:hypothetical protein
MMASPSVTSNTQFDDLLTDSIDPETLFLDQGQASWVAYADTDRTMIENRNAEITDPIFSSRLNEFIAEEISRVSDVDHIFTAFRNNVFYVWILLERFETTVRESIYEREKVIIDEFPMFDFDFYIVATEKQNPEDLISGSVELVYEKSRAI